MVNVDNLHIGTAMSGQFYADLLLVLQETIKDERQVKRRRGVLQWHDNSPIHINLFAMHTVYDHGFKLLQRSPQFIGLVRSDYVLFSKLKKKFRGQRYVNDNELTLAAEEFGRGCGSALYRLGGYVQPRRKIKHFTPQEGYVE